MKLAFILTFLLTGFSAMASSSFDLICSGKVSHFSPYPNASSSSTMVLKAKSYEMSGDFRQNRQSHKIDFKVLDLRGTNVILRGLTDEGEKVDLKLTVLGAQGPRITGKIGKKSLSFRCNRNLIIDL